VSAGSATVAATGTVGTVSLWRIGVDTPDYEASDLSGKGAEKTGGRWNRTGTPLVYSATSRALACLETVVHLARTPLPLNRYLVEIVVPASAWAAAVLPDPATLIGWDAEPAGKSSLDWGTLWARNSGSLLALVPSVIVPEEINVLINPRHPGIALITAMKVRRWTYDARLVRVH
jgi:RES domain-containing protein